MESKVTGTEVAALIASVATAILVTVLIGTLLQLNRTLRRMRSAVDEFERKAVPALDELAKAATTANRELDRVDGILDTAETVSQTVDSASKIAYLAFSNPAIKALALGAGTTRAWKRFRRRKGK